MAVHIGALLIMLGLLAVYVRLRAHLKLLRIIFARDTPGRVFAERPEVFWKKVAESLAIPFETVGRSDKPGVARIDLKTVQSLLIDAPPTALKLECAKGEVKLHWKHMKKGSRNVDPEPSRIGVHTILWQNAKSKED